MDAVTIIVIRSQADEERIGEVEVAVFSSKPVNRLRGRGVSFAMTMVERMGLPADDVFAAIEQFNPASLRDVQSAQTPVAEYSGVGVFETEDVESIEFQSPKKGYC